jgi:hypothetical protein
MMLWKKSNLVVMGSLLLTTLYLQLHNLFGFLPNVDLSYADVPSFDAETKQSLNIHLQTGTTILLMHIGKAGGTAFRASTTKAYAYCGRGNESAATKMASETSLLAQAHRDEQLKLSPLQIHMCALARVTQYDRLVHLDRNHEYVGHYNHFIIPIRNPLDRLVSWYHYEQYHMDVEETRYGKLLNTLVHECGYDTVDKLMTKGLAPTKSSGVNIRNKRRSCQTIAKDCLVGEYPCFAHNFFNYEYYLEDILSRVIKTQAQQSSAVNGSANDKTPVDEVRIDVIRSEQSWQDMNSTLQAWTGLPMTNDMDIFYSVGKPYGVHTEESNKTISPTGKEQLCRAICSELIVYKKILEYASNLSWEEKKKSMLELDEKCGFLVDDVCGTTFQYRNVKALRQDRMCDPSVEVTGSHYLKSNWDIPAC